MPQTITLQSFRRGTGKSLLAANLGALMAAAGWRVGLIDADLAAPALHTLCGLADSAISRTLNDYLRRRCDIEQTAHDLSEQLGAPIHGRLFLVPADPNLSEIARVLRQGYDLNLLDEGFQTLIEQLELDLLLIDSHAGLHEETLSLMALADVLALLLRPDQQDYQGTAVLLDVARRLDVPRVALIANQTPAHFDLAEAQAQLEQSYGYAVAGVLQYSEQLIGIEPGIFALRQPAHPLVATLRHIAVELAR